MKVKLLVASTVLFLVATGASASTVAYWHFNDGTNIGTSLWQLNPFGTDANRLEYQRDYADPGWTTSEVSVWGTDDTSEGTLVGVNGGVESQNFGSYTGTTVNALGTTVAGGSLSILGSNNNGHYFLIELDDAIQDCVLTLATRGTSTGYATHTVDYSTDNGQNWTFLESHAANKTSTYVVHTVNFGNVFASSSGHESNLIKITVTGATSANGNNRFDNITVTGIPEPASVALLLLGGLAVLRRR